MCSTLLKYNFFLKKKLLSNLFVSLHTHEIWKKKNKRLCFQRIAYYLLLLLLLFEITDTCFKLYVYSYFMQWKPKNFAHVDSYVMPPNIHVFCLISGWTRNSTVSTKLYFIQKIVFIAIWERSKRFYQNTSLKLQFLPLS